MHLISLAHLAFSAIAGVSLAYLVAALMAVRAWREQPPVLPARAPLPVSVLKPLCGMEPNLKENLRSFCRQDYPHYQLVFGVQDAADAALPVVSALQEEFPGVDIAV